MISMSYYRSFLVVLFFLFSNMALAAAPVPNIIKIRISDSPDVVRVVFDLTAPVKDRNISYQPGDPSLVLDIKNVVLAAALPKSASGSTLIKNYTSHVPSQNNVRFTFELATTVGPKLFSLSPADNYGHRLVLDLKKQTSPSTSSSIGVTTESVDDKTAGQPVYTPQAPVRVRDTDLPKRDNKSKQGDVRKEYPQEAMEVDLFDVLVSKDLPVMQSISEEALAPPSKAALKPQLVSSKNTSSRPLMIVIDPGHGGHDPGAIGMAGHREKTVVLEIGKILRDMFNEEKGYSARLTRDRDIYIPLRQRLAIARQNKADFFVSIHADAYKNPEAKGASIFALSDRGATSEMARWMAQKENESELLSGVHASNDKVLRSVLLDLSQTYAISTSLDVGQNILRHLGNMTYLHSFRVEQAAFVVLKSPDIPSLLVETGFISNPMQEEQLMSKAYQTKIARAIVHGVKDYFAKHPRN